MYNVLAFFEGAPDSSSAAHEVLAKRIGENSIDFVEHYWRWEDMQAYVSEASHDFLINQLLILLRCFASCWSMLEPQRIIERRCHFLTEFKAIGIVLF